MRVTGGSLSRRRLRPAPRGVRPTSDRVRESLFARLGDLTGARVLDLYAGCGTLGIEAHSRGAEEVIFVERATAALSVLDSNLSQLGLAERSRVIRGDACRSLVRLARENRAFELVMLDPPYASVEAARALAQLVDSKLVAPGGVVVVESAKRHPVAAVPGLEVLDRRSHGDTLVTELVSSSDGGLD